MIPKKLIKGRVL